jgi:predicted restriction endonuclease
MYLCQIGIELSVVLGNKIRPGILRGSIELLNMESAEYLSEKQVWDDPNLADTEREQLIMSRMGQGKFRERVYSFERTCRLTGVADPRLLVASHIKPWRDSDAREKLDGNNGLMLSPHVDKLFDRGFMSFSDRGKVIFSKGISDDVIRRWGLDRKDSVGTFTVSQKQYLEHHRDLVFENKGI